LIIYSEGWRTAPGLGYMVVNYTIIAEAEIKLERALVMRYASATATEEELHSKGLAASREASAKKKVYDIFLAPMSRGFFPVPRMVGLHHYYPWEKQKALRKMAVQTDESCHYIIPDRVRWAAKGWSEWTGMGHLAGLFMEEARGVM